MVVAIEGISIFDLSFNVVRSPSVLIMIRDCFNSVKSEITIQDCLLKLCLVLFFLHLLVSCLSLSH